MMRRGTLADHRVASVLRQAATERLSGQIDIDGDRPAVVYLADGELALACWADDEVEIAVDDEADDATYSAAILTEERRLRAASRDVLGLLLDREDGWYHHHPLGEHRAAALWSWPVEEVLAEVAVRANRPAAEGAAPADDEDDDGAVDDAADEAAPVESAFDEIPATTVDVGPPASASAPATPVPPAAEPSRRDGPPPGSAPTPPVAHRASAEAIAARRPSVPGRPSPLDAVATPATPAAPTAAPSPPAAPAPAAEAPTGPAWQLAPTAPTEPLDEAAWAVVVALAGRASVADIASRLGWPEVRADIVLRSLESRGVVVATEDPAG